MTSIKDLKKQYETAGFAHFPGQAKLLLICVNETVRRVFANELTLLDAVRYSWVISPKRAEQAEYVLAVAHGLILGAYVADKPWLPATKENFPGIPDDHGNWKKQKRRYGFRGREAPGDIGSRYVGKRVPDEYRNHGAPIRFVHF
jgi:uncharacterized protein